MRAREDFHPQSKLCDNSYTNSKVEGEEAREPLKHCLNPPRLVGTTLNFI